MWSSCSSSILKNFNPVNFVFAQIFHILLFYITLWRKTIKNDFSVFYTLNYNLENVCRFVWENNCWLPWKRKSWTEENSRHHDSRRKSNPCVENYPQNFTVVLEASLLGQLFIFRTIFQPWALFSDIPATERGLFIYLLISKLILLKHLGLLLMFLTMWMTSWMHSMWSSIKYLIIMLLSKTLNFVVDLILTWMRKFVP